MSDFRIFVGCVCLRLPRLSERLIVGDRENREKINEGSHVGISEQAI